VSSAGPRAHLFGVDIDAVTMDETIDMVMRSIDEGRHVQHVVLNAAKVVAMSKDSALRDVISACPIVNADGMSVVVASRLLRQPLPERVAGIDLFVQLVERAAVTGHRVFFLGARDEVLDAMVDKFRKQYPTLVVAGYRNGYWSDDDDVIAEVCNSNADMLFLAVPSPRKEFWLAANLPRLGTPFAMGVGGSFDVVAGTIKRAPVWVQKIGCEWMYRVAQEPRRMWKRYLVGNTMFMWLTAKEMVKRT
jgi:N-acetylglucosaminyldiphosphoundecaprenol N-acetyl-beta-D-mannosaminyltransferase